MSDHDGHSRSYEDRQPHTRDNRTSRRDADEENRGSVPMTPPEATVDAKDQLAAQARIAAEQAVQLARLAEASAQLALRLNEQAFGSDGRTAGSDEERRHAGGLHRISGADVERTHPVNLPEWELSGRRRQAFLQSVPIFESAAALTPPEGSLRRSRRLTARSRARRVRRPRAARTRRRNSILISTVLHATVLLLLACVTMVANSDIAIDTVLASFAEEPAVVEESVPLENPVEEVGEQLEQPVPDEAPPVPEEPEAARAEEAENAPENVQEDAVPPIPGPEAAEPAVIDLAKVGSRSGAGKELLLQKYGGSAESESAVQRALDWFASRQRPDGSWNFNDVGPCSHPGEIDNAMGATAYVLLCYLGAGETHLAGRFRNNVRAGLTFLLNNGRRVPAGGDFRGSDCREHDNFYVQAPVAMALSEAYQMTKDRRLPLRQGAQLAVDFLCHAQDPQGGGWRYEPREPGCTSVTALVAMALKSASDAGLTIRPQVLQGISHFLDTVRSESEPTGRYGYRVAATDYRVSTTAMALLCRMHLGWTRENEELQRGLAILDERGPYDNLYYCYYATQVMRHWGGPEWDRWNSVMREDLIRTQTILEGPEFGSWTPRDRGGPSVAGGRLFVTCLATMTLEVYYRYLPLYGLPDADDRQANSLVEAVEGQ